MEKESFFRAHEPLAKLPGNRYYGFRCASDAMACSEGVAVFLSISPNGVEESHPSRKNKYAARVGHPNSIPKGEMLYTTTPHPYFGRKILVFIGLQTVLRCKIVKTKELPAKSSRIRS
jgi:hypothetical protein